MRKRRVHLETKLQWPSLLAYWHNYKLFQEMITATATTTTTTTTTAATAAAATTTTTT
jgi:hypothetical protein